MPGGGSPWLRVDLLHDQLCQPAVGHTGVVPDSTADQPAGQTPGQSSVFAQLSGLLERTDGAETVIAAERSRADRADADALRERVDDLQAGQGLMMDMHVRVLAAAQGDLDMARAQATTAHGRAQGPSAGPRPIGRRGASWRGSGRRCGGGSRQPLPVGHA
jgi:hypothetical protein